MSSFNWCQNGVLTPHCDSLSFHKPATYLHHHQNCGDFAVSCGGVRTVSDTDGKGDCFVEFPRLGSGQASQRQFI
jgi:hypothetical protein